MTFLPFEETLPWIWGGLHILILYLVGRVVRIALNANRSMIPLRWQFAVVIAAFTLVAAGLSLMLSETLGIQSGI